ncbi:MAG: hypothetical protein AUJ28_00895 [Parcubacteria group bacterium CG1_02_37_51]|uniref:TraC-like domain-containing protein n=2 Tax=Candidatus Komeiliibacteriota TaxID=1817908 RepID=A0A2M8DRQ6_9BACT|nr:MAG: hypothetical protein AUJ28_00895 [Parcubacteria group bacterium CG1_02_37_51]PIY95106.1 MAG: hypothetical protein COY67_01425 [Candidatus Komeilibacteria bacterium CG_4_10_14_0_8_um_filter_37_78]PJC02026.1 MAG: hypothetical protein CO073_01650 [Candidatus Komeilibacteria bacterium CG_4_9_14_0_8_um_filter_36_9]
MKNKKSKSKKIASTQKYLFLSNIRDDVLVFKNQGLRAVLMVSAVNFALKGEDEQQSIVQGYISLINSLDFPIQISMQSRKLDIDNYVQRLDERAKAIDNELLKIQLDSYKKFIVELLTIGEIMSKKFYLIVPYEPGSKRRSGSQKKTFLNRFSEVFSPGNVLTMNKKTFDEYKSELERRVAVVETGLQSMGLGVLRLDTQSLIELFYNSYNPVTSEFERMKDINDLQLEMD